MSGYFAERETILFQGDSITEWWRDDSDARKSLGSGYALIVASMLTIMCPSVDFTFINRGVSGNRLKDLEERWTEDCIALKPTIVSIMIGVNDMWRRYDSGDPTLAEVFESRYQVILERVKNELGAKIIILEPFLLPLRDEQREWRDDLNPKIAAIHRVAAGFGALHIPLDSHFAAAAREKPATFWTTDGVHPTIAGNGLIADAWIQAVFAADKAGAASAASKPVIFGAIDGNG
jgi:lysophospholipase L1-like esterase